MKNYEDTQSILKILFVMKNTVDILHLFGSTEAANTKPRILLVFSSYLHHSEKRQNKTLSSEHRIHKRKRWQNSKTKTTTVVTQNPKTES